MRPIASALPCLSRAPSATSFDAHVDFVRALRAWIRRDATELAHAEVVAAAEPREALEASVAGHELPRELQGCAHLYERRLVGLAWSGLIVLIGREPAEVVIRPDGPSAATTLALC